MARLLSALLAMFLATAAHGEERRQPLLVFAAASLTNVLGEIGDAWNSQSSTAVKFSFAASSMLARQIEAGGRADIFVSADQEWMDYLAGRSLIDSVSRVDVVGNRMVLIAAADSRLRLTLEPGSELGEALGGGRLSIADPDVVPAGRYARQALGALGLWRQVSGRLARADNVRAALLFVARGETPLGIVYATDAQIEEKVRVVATFPDNSHQAVTYPAAATASAQPEAHAFLAYLRSVEAMQVWKKHGFLELKR